jgi:hypothetical protein
MSRLKSFYFLFFGISLLFFSSCGKSYNSNENSIPIDIYLSGPMRLSEDEIDKNDSIAILLNLINGRMPQINFHRLDLGDSVFRDTIEMGFFNRIFVDLIDINDMKEDLNNKVFGSNLKAFLTAPRGNDLKELDSMKSCLPIDSILRYKDESKRTILEKIFIKNGEINNGRILISFLPSKNFFQNQDSITDQDRLVEVSVGASGTTPQKDSDGDGVIDSKDNCIDEFGSKQDGGCPAIGRLTISDGGAVSWSGTTKVLYLSIRYSTARDKEIIKPIEVKNGDKIQIPGVQNTNDEQFYIIKYGRQKGSLGNEITVKCTNFL